VAARNDDRNVFSLRDSTPCPWSAASRDFVLLTCWFARVWRGAGCTRRVQGPW